MDKLPLIFIMMLVWRSTANGQVSLNICRGPDDTFICYGSSDRYPSAIDFEIGGKSSTSLGFRPSFGQQYYSNVGPVPGNPEIRCNFVYEDGSTSLVSAEYNRTDSGDGTCSVSASESGWKVAAVIFLVLLICAVVVIIVLGWCLYKKGKKPTIQHVEGAVTCDECHYKEIAAVKMKQKFDCLISKMEPRFGKLVDLLKSYVSQNQPTAMYDEFNNGVEQLQNTDVPHTISELLEVALPYLPITTTPAKLATSSQPPAKLATSSQPPAKLATSSQPPAKLATSSQPPAKLATLLQTPAESSLHTVSASAEPNASPTHEQHTKEKSLFRHPVQSSTSHSGAGMFQTETVISGVGQTNPPQQPQEPEIEDIISVKKQHAELSTQQPPKHRSMEGLVIPNLDLSCPLQPQDSQVAQGNLLRNTKSQLGSESGHDMPTSSMLRDREPKAADNEDPQEDDIMHKRRLKSTVGEGVEVKSVSPQPQDKEPSYPGEEEVKPIQLSNQTYDASLSEGNGVGNDGANYYPTESTC